MNSEETNNYFIPFELCHELHIGCLSAQNIIFHLDKGALCQNEV